MSNVKTRWKLLGFVGIMAVVGTRLYGRFRRDLHAARERVDAGGSQVIETACGSIEFATFGAGYPVLVLHGISGGFDQGIVSARPALGEEFRAIVPSRFGYLRTPLPANASPASQADAYACLLDSMGVDRVAVIGYSAGATSAIQFALRHPDRLSALVLVSPNAPSAPGEKRPEPPQWVANIIYRSDFVFWLATTYFRSIVRRFALGVPPEFGLSPEDEVRETEFLETLLPMTSRSEGVLFDSYVSNPDIGTGYPFGDITTPVLVVSAKDEQHGTAENPRALAAQIPGAELFVVESGGHIMLGPEGKRASAEIRRFLTEHPASEGQAQNVAAQ